jgi:hypothetical protein
MFLNRVRISIFTDCVRQIHADVLRGESDFLGVGLLHRLFELAL